MQFVARAKYIKYSPYKLRPLVDVIRGKNAAYALNWLVTYGTKRSTPIMKALESAIANAKNLSQTEAKELAVKEIRVDQGPIRKYFKPGAMGRASIQRKRQSHISIVLETKNKTKEN